jgi:hypothetical protein
MRNLLVNIILVFCIFSFLPNSAFADIKDGLISVWSLDEGSGIYTEDQAGENHGLLLQGSTSSALPTWVTPGKLGNSHLLFTSGTTWSGPEPHGVLLNSDHTYDSHDIPTDLMPTIAVSVSAWVKADTFVYYAPIFYNGTWTGDTQSGFMMHTYNGLYNWWLKPETGSYGIVTYAGNTGQWYNLVGTYDGTLAKDQLKFYVDGVLVGKVRTSGPIDYDPIPYNCLIGAYNDDNENHEFLGEIDDVGVWDRALTQEEIDWIYNNGIGSALPGQPLVPTPANRAELVDCEQDLSWELIWEDFTVLGYDVYFGTDSNEISPNWYGNNKVVDNELVNTYDPDTLDNDTTYYWRVDIIEPNDVGTITRVGRMWQFTTCPDEIVITQQPQSQVVQIGDTAQLTVEALNTISYEWYKVNDPDISMGSGATMDTLEITNVQLGDEGQYYCRMSDSEGSKDSVIVSLWTKRLMGWWKLDGDGADSVALEVTGAPPHDAALPVDPNFSSDGIDNQSYEFFGDSGRIIVIPGTSDFFNFYPLGYTVSAWVKNPNAGWGGIAGKQNEARTPDYGWVLNHNGDIGYSTLRQTPAHDYGANVGLLDGDWHLVVGMFDAEVGQVRFYADGVLAAQSGDGITGILGSDTDMCIGAESTDGASPLTGLVDDVRIYNYVLSELEVAEMYLTFKPDEDICINSLELEMDFDGDCKVGINDFAEIAATWAECNIVPTCLP